MTDLQARAEAAADAVGEAIQKAWDDCQTLPAIDLDEAERTALGKAAAMAALQSEGWRPILPPASVGGDYLEGWCDGQTCLIDAYSPAPPEGEGA